MSPSTISLREMLRRLRRRFITVSLFALVGLALAISLPLWLPLGVVIDVMRRSRLSTTRAFLFLLVLFWLETLGVLAAFAIWIPRAVRSVDEARFIAWNHALQRVFVKILYSSMLFVFSLDVDARNIELCRGGPLVVFFRHVSVGDTLFPGIFLSVRTGMRLRYVLKSELLFDPCLDIVGNRIPNAFVTRDGSASDEEIDKVRMLARGLADDEGILLFPEGTRFSPQKRARALEKLRERDPARYARASSIRHALPPKTGGSLAILDENPSADVLFCAHTGLEGISSIAQLFDGTLVGRRVVLQFWRVPSASIPREREARIDWLYDEWKRIDRVVDDAAIPTPFSAVVAPAV